MNKIKNVLKDILKENISEHQFYKRNMLKEYLQVFVLEYIYTNEKYKDLIFYGGSCLSQCYSLPRLSEDLDFVDLKKNISLEELTQDLKEYFNSKTDLPLETKIQKFRIYLKFPILKELGLAGVQETDWLFLKVEIFKGFDFCKNFKTEVKPIFKLNKSLLIKTFDLPTLMSTKIRAVLQRKWEKTSKTGETLLSVKGRDYFDLMWYLEKGIKPNMGCVGGRNLMKLKTELIDNIKKADSRSIKMDLENFVSDKNFAVNLSKNIKDILIAQIKEMNL